MSARPMLYLPVSLHAHRADPTWLAWCGASRLPSSTWSWRGYSLKYLFLLSKSKISPETSQQTSLVQGKLGIHGSSGKKWESRDWLRPTILFSWGLARCCSKQNRGSLITGLSALALLTFWLRWFFIVAAVLCVVGYLAAFQTLTHQMPGAFFSHQLCQPNMSPDVSRCALDTYNTTVV